MAIKHIKSVFLLTAGLLAADISYAQPFIDARGVGLCGAYTIASRGFAAVGYNPANLGFVDEVPFSFNITNNNFIVRNNFLTLGLYNQFFTGDPDKPDQPLDLETKVPGKKYTYKSLLKGYIPTHGLVFDLGTNISLPGLNVSWGNYAVTSGLQVFWETNFPKPLFKLMLELNPVGSSYNMSFQQNILMVQHLAFSFAIPFPGYKVGMTMKYLAGLGYAAVDSSGGYFYTGKKYIQSDSYYQIRRAVGGDGVALDFGFTSDRKDKWQFGAAVNNVIGKIYWGRRNYINRNIKFIEKFFPVRSTLGIPLENGRYTQSTLNQFVLDSINVQRFFVLPADSLFRKSTTELPDSAIGEFSSSYPAILRFGTAYFLNPEVTFYFDLSTGFVNYYFARKQWRFAMATEVTHFKNLPLRTGLAWGGEFSPEMSFGTGFSTGWAQISLGLRVYGGYSITTATGFQLATTMSFRRLKKSPAAE